MVSLFRLPPTTVLIALIVQARTNNGVSPGPRIGIWGDKNLEYPSEGLSQIVDYGVFGEARRSIQRPRETPLKRIQNPAIFDATGTWQYTTSNASPSCNGTTRPPVSGTLSFTQTGTKVTATTLVNGEQVEYRGFLSGSTYTLIRSYLDNGGTASQVITVDLSNGGTGSGSCDWVWTNGVFGQGCGGLFDISMTRAALAVTASAGSGGSISPSGSVSVAYGGSQTFTITPNPGYRVRDVLVDGVSVGAVKSYTFSNVQVAHTIEAFFTASRVTPLLQLLLGD